MKKIAVLAAVLCSSLLIPFNSFATESGTIIVPSPTGQEATINSETSTTKGNRPMLVTEGDEVRIYVSKMAKRVSLYKNAVLVNVWDCNLGKNSLLGDKNEEGDGRTPSGSFYVCTRNDKSIAYLSLGLSYPSIDDAERGFAQGIISEAQRDEIKQAIAKGVRPPWDTALGGEIMIHGGYQAGGSTRGCVAVANEVMDVLWQYAKMGARVDVGP